MNPITMINQEFARMVVEDWTDEAAMRRQVRKADKSRGSIVAVIRALVIHVRICIDRSQPTMESTPRRQPAKRSNHS